MITIEIAGLPIGIDNKYEHLSIQARDYLSDKEPIFTVSVSEDEIDAERKITGTDYPSGYYESVMAYRKIADKLPEYDAFLFHGCVIELDGKAYIFTAKSGVGKTTHMRIWISQFGREISVINGDKPTVRIIDGVPYASGTPWRGKEGYGKNVVREVAGIVFVNRGEVNIASKITAPEALNAFMSQIYLPRKNQPNLIKTMRLADSFIKAVRLVRLECNMEPEAAHVCRRALLEND